MSFAVRALLLGCGVLTVIVAHRTHRVLVPSERYILVVVGWSLILYVLYLTLRSR